MTTLAAIGLAAGVAFVLALFISAWLGRRTHTGRSRKRRR